MASEDAAVTDHRVLRGKRNRDAVVRAVVELMEDGELDPTAAQIAARAGVAVRSIYHHFEDLEGLRVAVSDEHFRGIADLLTPLPTGGPLQTRLASFVEHRAALFERAMSVYRASLLTAARSPAVAERLAVGHAFLRAEMAEVFATELQDQPSWKLETLDALTSFDGWVRVRITQGLTVERTQQVLTAAMGALLDEPHRGH